MSLEQAKKLAIETIMDEINGNKIHIKTIGRTLIDYGINNLPNLREIELFLTKEKVMIVRG